jgi:membrane protein DedA with SNARE-associated domain
VEDLIADLGAFIERHSFWAGPVLGLITFGESMVFIGAFFPATALMVVAGGLAASGVLHPIPVILWCVAGAVAGDAISYWIGRKVGPKAWRHPWMLKHRTPLARARLFFRKYGVASIYLCRFMGPVRAFVPLIAGVTAMPHRRFQIANVGSALVWVPVMLAPGYLAAKGVKWLGFGGDAHTLGWVLAAAVLGMIAATVAWRRVKARLKLEDEAAAADR